MSCMLGFTLSKLNLLILVTAIFAIVSFFMFGLTDMIISNAAQRMVNNYAQSISIISSSKDMCYTTSATVPEVIEYFGGMQLTKRYYYLMYINREPKAYQEGKLSTLILQVASRKEPDKLIAAKGIVLNARITFFEWPIEETGVFAEVKESESITIDPMSPEVPKNTFKLVKETYLGKSYLYIIACSSASGVCEQNMQKASCLLGRSSPCFPPCGG